MNHSILAHPLLTKSLLEAPVVQRGEYDYLIHPLTDGVPRTDPALLQEAAEGLEGLLEEELASGIDLFLTAEAMGLPLVAMLSARTGVPYAIARKRSYGLPQEIPLDQVTGYSRTKLHLNDVGAGDRVVIIDDLVSTGGTLRALVAGLQQAGAVPVAVATCVTKQEDLDPLALELGCPVRALASVEIHEAADGKNVQVTATDLRGDPQ